MNLNIDTAQEMAKFIDGMDNSIIEEILNELFSNYPDEKLQAAFARKGYIFEPIKNWLDLYEKGEI